MNKMRESTGAVLWILVFAFGGIWVISDTGALDAVSRSSSENIGYVDGEPISREAFVNALNQYEQQATRSGNSLTQAQRDQYSDLVFNSLVDQILRSRELERLGLAVTDDEVRDMIWGSNPDPQIKNLFPDGNAGVNYAALENFQTQQPQDWLAVQESLREGRLRSKLDQLIASTVFVSDADVVEEHRRRNQKLFTDYIALRYADVPDSLVTVTERDLRAFYNANKEEFRRQKTYSLQVASVNSAATVEDTVRVRTEIGTLRDAFAEATDAAQFLLDNQSDVPFDSTYKNASTLLPQIADRVYADLTVGRVVGPVSDGTSIHLLKILGTRPIAKPLLKTRHILFGSTDKLAPSHAIMRAQADSVKALIVGGADFGLMARQFSTGPSGPRGGDLGWSDGDNYVTEFKAAVQSAPVGTVIGPVETDFGWHLVEVTQKAASDVQLADLVRSVAPGSGSQEQLRRRMEDLQYYADETGSLKDQAAKYSEVAIQPTAYEDGTETIPLLGRSRNLINFLKTASAGDLSPVTDLDDRLVVVQVESIAPEGFAPFEEVRSQLEPRVRLEKKKEIQVAKFKRASDGGKSFDQVMSALGLTVRTASELTFNSSIVPTLGREPKFIGAALAMDPNDVSKMIVGENAVYMIKMKNRETIAPEDIDIGTRTQLRDELVSQRRSQIQARWIAELREKAKIEDNRSVFGM